MNFRYFLNSILLLGLFAFNSAVFFSHATAQTLIVALGDSLTEGFGVSKEEAYPFLVEQELIDMKLILMIVYFKH